MQSLAGIKGIKTNATKDNFFLNQTFFLFWKISISIWKIKLKKNWIYLSKKTYKLEINQLEEAG